MYTLNHILYIGEAKHIHYIIRPFPPMRLGRFVTNRRASSTYTKTHSSIRFEEYDRSCSQKNANDKVRIIGWRHCFIYVLYPYCYISIRRNGMRIGRNVRTSLCSVLIITLNYYTKQCFEKLIALSAWFFFGVSKHKCMYQVSRVTTIGIYEFANYIKV